MGTPQTNSADPDFAQGVPVDRLSDGRMLAGYVGQEPVLLVRRGDDFFAVGATCTHYGGPLAEGLVVGDTVRCPWHHACFSLKTAEALHAPAFSRWHTGESSGATIESLCSAKWSCWSLAEQRVRTNSGWKVGEADAAVQVH